MNAPNSSTTSPPDERLDLYDEAVPWSVRERHLRRYVDAVCWVMEYRQGRAVKSWADLGAGTMYSAAIIDALASPRAIELIDRDIIHNERLLDVGSTQWDLRKGFPLLLSSPFTVVSAIEVLEHLPRDCWDRLLSDISERTDTFVGSCPIGHDGPNPKNPHHLFEPTRETLEVVLSAHFSVTDYRYSRATLTTGEEQETVVFLCVP